MLATAELIIIMLITILYICQYRRSKDLHKSISAAARYLRQEHDSFRPLLDHTDNRDMQELLTAINSSVLKQYRLSQKFCTLKTQYRTNIADISHDLKTPITTLSGYIDLLDLKYQQFGNNASEVNEVLQKTKQKSQTMQHVILQQLDFARICSGDVQFPMRETDLTELCREIILSYYDLLQAQGFQVKLGLGAPSIHVQTSPTAITCILHNLIDNAIRYGDSGKFLELGISEDDKNAVIHLTDHGPGISPAEQTRIFERNYRIGDTRLVGKDRTGLGLSIATRVAARCRMKIELDSQSGRTTFSVIVRKTLESPHKNDDFI